MRQVPKTRPVRPAAPRASRAAAEILARLARQTRYADASLSDNWPTIAGAEIAALGRPGRVLGNGPGRTLEVVVADAAAATELQMRADALVVAVNRYLGPGAVARIAIKQRPRPARPPSAAEPADPNDQLGAALSAFRSSVSARNSTE